MANDTNNRSPDVFVHDRQTGTTELVSVDSSGTQANSASSIPSISSDGRFVSFGSYASNLVANDTNRKGDIFVRDRRAGTTQRVSVDSSGNQARGGAFLVINNACVSISPSGRFVAFSSPAPSLVANDTNGSTDVFVHDQQTGTTQRVSVNSLEKQGNGYSAGPFSISFDGRFVAFESGASNLVPNDTNGYNDIFVRDRRTGTTQRMSVDSSGNQGNDSSWGASINADGRFVTFTSRAKALVPNDTSRRKDVFVHERDATAPKVRRVVPTDGATDVALKANVVATFSERMTKSTLKKANFELYRLIKNPDGTTTTRQITDVTVTPSPDGLKATLNPFGGSDQVLVKGARYKAIVNKGAMDVFGNPLDQQPRVSGNQPKEWYFKTGG